MATARDLLPKETSQRARALFTELAAGDINPRVRQQKHNINKAQYNSQEGPHSLRDPWTLCVQVSDVGGLAPNATCFFRYEIISMHQRESNKKVSRHCPFPSIHLILGRPKQLSGAN